MGGGARFGGRWDDAEGRFRMLYAADSLSGCLIELLAPLRPDRSLAAELSAIDTAPDDAQRHPTSWVGLIDTAWLDNRAAGRARITGSFCDVVAAASIAHLHQRLIGRAKGLGFADVDVAVLHDARSRPLTQMVARYVFQGTELDGLRYFSRHGNDLGQWALFERRVDQPPACLVDARNVELRPDGPALVAALEDLGSAWLDPAVVPPPAIAEVDRG